MSSRATSERTTNRPESVTISYSDTLQLPRKKVAWTPNGVSLVTKWPFAIGAEVEFAFDHRGQRHCCVGIVVSCRALPRQPGRA